MTKAKTYWFIWAKDAHTNGVIAMMKDVCLAEYPNCLCSDGKYRNLWEITSAGVDLLVKSKNDQNLSFRVFKRAGRNGKVYPA